MLAEDLTRREKMVILVDAIIGAVSNQPSDFNVIVKVLEDKPFHRSLARLLQQSHGNAVTTVNTIIIIIITFNKKPLNIRTRSVLARYSCRWPLA